VRKQFFSESIFRHHQVGIESFSSCARAPSFTVIVGDGASADWKQLKEQLCNCGDANVDAFLSNYRRSNAVMQLSLLNLALLRPLRAFVTPNSLFSTIQFIPQHVFGLWVWHSNLQVLPRIWTSIRNKSTKNSTKNLKIGISLQTTLTTGCVVFAAPLYSCTIRPPTQILQLECLFQQGQSSGLKVFIGACLREAGVMVLTHQDVSETSQSLFANVTRPASTSVQRSSVTFDPSGGRSSSAALPLKAQAPPASPVSLREKPIPEDNREPPTNSAASATGSVVNPWTYPIVFEIKHISYVHVIAEAFLQSRRMDMQSARRTNMNSKKRQWPMRSTFTQEVMRPHARFVSESQTLPPLLKYVWYLGQ
jgi:hypothetical protein